ncbi:MAG: hypothetical protein K0S71_1110 [Clostridia bacterium]|jgi:uncharacterized protein (TIGR00299 family) protein|nr:hypothetical protein [Clostridia bacterium]
MKVLYYDCFCGISGDMNLAALLDLGVPAEYLTQEISKLKLDAEYEIKIEKAAKQGITGIRVDVILKNQSCSEHPADGNHHEHGNINGHHHTHVHHHAHSEVHTHIKKDEHHHRNIKDIENIISSSSLNDKVKKLSMDMFMKIAEAEAKVHGKALHEVHFHEVGAVDSIIDMVGAAICLDYLEVDKILASPVQVGGGFVKCAHGLMPVPAPATVEILKEIPINTGIVPFETTTPTGAAILAANVQKFTPKIDFAIKKIAYGIGHRDLEIPNVLRVYLGETKEYGSPEIEEQYMLETNIDDMNPEFYGYIEEKLFEGGALDVFKTPISMKKGRPGVKLSVLVNKQSEENILDIIFTETTSIGIRKYKVEKIMLNRDFSKIKTQYGEVTIKQSYYKGELIKYKPEYEECRSIAKENNITIDKVYKEIHKKIGELYDK